MQTLNEQDWTKSGWHPADAVLLMILDGELDEKQLALGRSHLDACWSCRARSEELQSTISSFVKYNDSILSPLIDREPRQWGGFKARLNDAALELGNRQPWYRSLLTAGSRLNLFRYFERISSRLVGLPIGFRAALVAAIPALVVVGLVSWLAISPSTSISASEILSESEKRAGLWYRQPDKVLHWSWETTLVNSPQLPDGKYRSLNWLNNTDGRSLRLSRKYDQNGVLVWAAWSRPDGSQVVYNRFPKDELAVYPANDALREYAAGLDERQRQTAERYLELSEKLRQIEAAITTKEHALDVAFNNASVQIIQDANIGKVFRIKVVSKPTVGERVSAAEMEFDIAADTFIKHRTRSVKHHLDGTIAVEEAKLGSYREASVEEFNANDLSKEMGQSTKIIYVTPGTFLRHVTPEMVLKMAESIERITRRQQPAK